MGLMEVVMLPVRLARLVAEATLGAVELVSQTGAIRRGGGVVDRVNMIVGENGLLDQLVRLLIAPNGPIAFARTLAALTEKDRPIGQALAKGGTFDRIFADDGVLLRLAMVGGPLDKLLREGGPADRILADRGVLDRLLDEDGFVDKLVAEDGIIEQLIGLGETLAALTPRLAALQDPIGAIEEATRALTAAAQPFTDLAGNMAGRITRQAFGRKGDQPEPDEDPTA